MKISSGKYKKKKKKKRENNHYAEILRISTREIFQAEIKYCTSQDYLTSDGRWASSIYTRDI